MLTLVSIAVIAYTYQRILRDVLKIGTRRKTLLGKVTLNLTADEEKIAGSLIDPASLQGGFDTVGGHENAKRVLEENVLWPIRHPDLFEHNGAHRHLPTGILLHGLPGTGKTLIARALAKELDAFFLNLSIDQLLSLYVGESEKLAAAVFTLAAKLKNCIIFIDEIDSFLSVRTTTETAVYTHIKSIFLTNWDGIQQPQSGSVVIVGATNRMSSLDEAVLRRLPVKIVVDPPSECGRREILRMLLAAEGLVEPLDTAPDADADADADSPDPAEDAAPLHPDSSRTGAAAAPRPPSPPRHRCTPEEEAVIAAVAAASKGYTGADLREVCKLVRTSAMRSVFAEARAAAARPASSSSSSQVAAPAGLPPLTTQQFTEAMSHVPPSVRRTDGSLDPLMTALEHRLRMNL